MKEERRLKSRWTVSPRRFERISLWSIWSLAAIVLTGAAVRLTGSGLGCPDWPTCEDERLVSPWEFHAVIEFGNRVITGLVGLAVALAVLGSLRRIPRRWDLVWWSLGLVGGVLAQVVLGAFVVSSHLTPWIVMSHFLVSMVLLWNAIVLHHRAKLALGVDVDAGVNLSLDMSLDAELEAEAEPVDDPSRDPSVPSRLSVSPDPSVSSDPSNLSVLYAAAANAGTRILMWVLGALGAWVLISGTVVTGAGPHGGDEEAERLNYDIGSVARIHAVSVIVLLVLVLWLVWRLYRSDLWRRCERASYVLLGVIAGQGFIGYVQYFNDVPELLVAMHIIGAIAVWWSLLNLHLTVLPPRARSWPPWGDGRGEMSAQSQPSSHHKLNSPGGRHELSQSPSVKYDQ